MNTYGSMSDGGAMGVRGSVRVHVCIAVSAHNVDARSNDVRFHPAVECGAKGGELREVLGTVVPDGGRERVVSTDVVIITAGKWWDVALWCSFVVSRNGDRQFRFESGSVRH